MGNPRKQRFVDAAASAAAATPPRKVQPLRTQNRDERLVWDMLAPELLRLNLRFTRRGHLGGCVDRFRGSSLDTFTRDTSGRPILNE